MWISLRSQQKPWRYLCTGGLPPPPCIHTSQRGEKVTNLPDIPPWYMEDSYGEEMREKQVTPCIFIKGVDSSVAAIKRSVITFMGCGWVKILPFMIWRQYLCGTAWGMLHADDSGRCYRWHGRSVSKARCCCAVLGLSGRVLVKGRMQEWLLWEAARSFLWEATCPKELMLVSFKMDPPMDKVKLISNCASMLVISYLRRGKNTQLQMKRVVKICERNNSIETKVKEEGGEGDAPGARAV